MCYASQSCWLAARDAHGDLNDRLAELAEIPLCVRLHLEEMKEVFELITLRAQETTQAMELLSVDHDSWTFATNQHGVTSYSRKNSDGSLTMRLEGEFQIPIFEQAAVAHEFDLYKEWVPFCQNSLSMAKLSHSELVAYMNIFVAPFQRDTLLHIFTSDCLFEANKFIIIGKSIEKYPLDPSSDMTKAIKYLRQVARQNSDDSLLHVEDADVKIPWLKLGWFDERVNIKEFKAVIEMTSPTSTKAHNITTSCLCVSVSFRTHADSLSSLSAAAAAPPHSLTLTDPFSLSDDCDIMHRPLLHETPIGR